MPRFLVVIRYPAQPVISELVADALRRAAHDYAVLLEISPSAAPTADELVGTDAVLTIGETLDLPDDSPPVLHFSPEAVLTDPSRALVSALALHGSKERTLSIVAVTACTVGVTHAFMAAEGSA